MPTESMTEFSTDLERERLHTLFDQAPAPFVILRGPEHVIELANQHTCRVWGRRHEEVIGRPLLEALPELKDQVFKQLLDDVLRTGSPCEGTETRARVDRRGDGTLDDVYFNFVYTPMRSATGSVDGVLVMAFDVTEQVLARQRTDELRRQAEAANRAKDEFLAMLGHELRNPLAPIKTALHLMRMRDDGKLEKELAVIARQVDYVVRLVDDLLDVSRIARGKIELAVERVEIAEVVTRAIETASPLLEQRRHRLTVSVPREGLAVDGDADRLAQVVSNLLTNAAKYTEENGQITVTAEPKDDEIILEVSDTGIGIDPSLLPSVFDMFTQVRQTIDRSRGGLGLGLSIVRSLVTLHGGTVAAYSEGLGRGSKFVVRLPASTNALQPAQAERASASLASIHEDGSRRRVLVVDDNVDAANALARYMSAIGYTTRTANDGPEALRIATELVPDVVLLDLGLPVMDGYEVARHLRERADLRHVRIIAITGYGQESDRRSTRAAGFDVHMVKPVDPDVLATLIRDGTQ